MSVEGCPQLTLILGCLSFTSLLKVNMVVLNSFLIFKKSHLLCLQMLAHLTGLHWTGLLHTLQIQIILFTIVLLVVFYNDST